MKTPNPRARQGDKPEDMRRVTGHIITLAVFFLPAILLAGIGLTVGNEYTAEGFAILWIALVTAVSLKFQRKRTFLVVERFGLFWDIKFAGPRIVIPFIDNPVLTDDFLQKQVPLYMRDTGSESAERIAIDFANGSAPISAAAWYQIGNPTTIEKGDWESVRGDILKYTYRVRADERDARVAEIFQGAFRVYLEGGKTIAEAQKEMEALAKQGTEDAKKALKEIGVYPFPKKGIIVKDIDLPQEIIELRTLVQRGEMEAQEAINRFRSFSEPLKAMKKNLTEGEGSLANLSDQEILSFFLAQKGFETLQKTGSNVSLVASDLGGVLKTITLGEVPRSSGAPRAS